MWYNDYCTGFPGMKKTLCGVFLWCLEHLFWIVKQMCCKLNILVLGFNHCYIDWCVAFSFNAKTRRHVYIYHSYVMVNGIVWTVQTRVQRWGACNRYVQTSSFPALTVDVCLFPSYVTDLMTVEITATNPPAVVSCCSILSDLLRKRSEYITWKCYLLLCAMNTINWTVFFNNVFSLN